MEIALIFHSMDLELRDTIAEMDLGCRMVGGGVTDLGMEEGIQVNQLARRGCTGNIRWVSQEI
jgi:hypothetical protein